MPSTFKRSEVAVGTSRTAIYGPVAAGTQAIVFAGTFANTDVTNKADHKFTLEVRNAAAAYVPILQDVPVPYGGSSKCPKLVLVEGEYLYATAATVSTIEAVVNILEKS